MEMDGHESDLDGSVRKSVDKDSPLNSVLCQLSGSPVITDAVFESVSNVISLLDLEPPQSNNDEELSDIHDEDSDDHLSRVQEDGNDADILSKLKQQVRNMERNEDHLQNQTPPTPHENPPGLSPFPHQFPLPLPFPFPHPAAAAFLPPVSGGHVPAYPAPPPHNSSGSSHSSESSNSSQQQTWSFEEQFKQVRQLYEINDDPKRKEFLDDLFSFMQKRAFGIRTRTMRTPIVKSTNEEIKQKLLLLYSSSFDLDRNVLDFDKKYDFFSTDKSLVLKYSSNWFRPEKYSFQSHPLQGVKHFQTLDEDEGGNQKNCPHIKLDSMLKVEKPIVSTNLTRDLEVLGRTPYQIGVDGEKFRVVAATLQKCNSPFVRRTFHFTSNGIVEAPERKTGSETVIPFIKQTKHVVSPQKFVRIRRFRVIKKNDLALEKYILPQKIKITNGEKTRFLTVRIRPKISNFISGNNTISEAKAEMSSSEMQKFVLTTENEPELEEAGSSSIVHTEDTTDEVQVISPNTSEFDTSTASLDPNEEVRSEKTEDLQQAEIEETPNEEKNESSETFSCDSCGKHFPTYLSCLTHIRSHQRQVCQFCSKKFLTAKMLRDHIKIHHQHRVSKMPEDRITTATSKFGRTRQVLNVAGLRSKYKML